MVDPDAPTAKAAKCRYWLHWAVTDVDGRHLRNGVNWMASEGRILKGTFFKLELNRADLIVGLLF